MHLPRTTRNGLTLLELIVVLVILVALAGVLVPLVTSTSDDARLVTTRATMKALSDAVRAYAQDMKGVQVGAGSFHLSTGMPRTLADLQRLPTDDKGNSAAEFNPATRRGWRGPYLQQATGQFDLVKLAALDPRWTEDYGKQGDPAFLDGWGFPIVLQLPTGDATAKYARLVSGGPAVNAQGVLVSAIDTPKDDLMPAKTARGNDLVLFLRTQDLNP